MATLTVECSVWVATVYVWLAPAHLEKWRFSTWCLAFATFSTRGHYAPRLLSLLFWIKARNSGAISRILKSQAEFARISGVVENRRPMRWLKAHETDQEEKLGSVPCSYVWEGRGLTHRCHSHRHPGVAASTCKASVSRITIIQGTA